MEEARLRSLHPTMVQAGYQEMLFEDFADVTYDLLREIATAVNDGHDAHSMLLDKFNQTDINNCVISHLRVGFLLWGDVSGSR
jgi:ubiquitin thioesterase protein OTUB1